MKAMPRFSPPASEATTMSAQSHAFGEASTIGEAPMPITMIPNIALGALICVSSDGGRFARIGAVSIQVAGVRANPTSAKAAQATRALGDGSLSMTTARTAREAQMRAAASPTATASQA
jgi:hypothetical protein